MIYPNTTIARLSRLGEGCVVGPNARLSNATAGDRVTVRESVIIDATIGDDVSVGPFAHLRGDTQLADRVHVGNFVEIKKSNLARGAKVSHLSYLGDATIGEETNVGAGTITCNYDGEKKNATIVGRNVVDRLEHVAGRAGYDRRRRADRRRLGRDEGRSRRRARRRQSGAAAAEKMRLLLLAPDAGTAARQCGAGGEPAPERARPSRRYAVARRADDAARHDAGRSGPTGRGATASPLDGGRMAAHGAV